MGKGDENLEKYDQAFMDRVNDYDPTITLHEALDAVTKAIESQVLPSYKHINTDILHQELIHIKIRLENLLDARS